MSNGPHEHNWHYGEPQKIYPMGKLPYFEVVKWCERCRKAKIIELEDITGIESEE